MAILLTQFINQLNIIKNNLIVINLNSNWSHFFRQLNYYSFEISDMANIWP